MSGDSGPRIVLDARPLSHPQAGGFRSYVRALVQGWTELEATGDTGGAALLLYLDRPLESGIERIVPPAIETRILSPDRLRTDLRLFREQLKRDSPDLVHGTANYLPYLPPRTPATVTLHDAMGLKRYPWDAAVRRTPREWLTNRYWALRTRASARRARRIVTVSHGSAAEISGVPGIAPDSLRVIYNGLVLPVPCRERSREPNTILAIESPDPRKNVALLYRVLSHHREAFGSHPPRLIIVANGPAAMARTEANLRQFPGIEAQIIPNPSDQALSDLYAGASVFAWPSRLEGFGLPPLEAMRNGCAVVSSSAPAMPEILGDIPLYASPDDTAAFATQLALLLNNPAERDDRARRGRAYAATFTCRRMAEETVSVWREALVP